MIIKNILTVQTENVPSDDINPQDTDGDGIPDSIENLTGTDWRNPDTDGGGMSDYDECPPQFWGTLCVGSNYDPFDPTDDVTNEDVIFGLIQPVIHLIGTIFFIGELIPMIIILVGDMVLMQHHTQLNL